MIKLLPCPFCANTEYVPDLHQPDNASTWLIMCGYCCAQGSEADTTSQAARNWNNRPLAPATPHVELPIADELSAMFNLPPYPNPTRGAEQVAMEIVSYYHKLEKLHTFIGEENTVLAFATRAISAAIDEAVGEMRRVLEEIRPCIYNMSRSCCNDNHDNQAADMLYEIDKVLTRQHP